MMSVHFETFKADKALLFFSIITLTWLSIAQSTGSKCLVCYGKGSARDCTPITCGNNEQCFLEKIINDNATVVYNGGCRSNQVCKLMSTLVGKRSLVACSECCSSTSTSPCNANLCGLDIAQPAPVHHSGMYCLGCKNAVDPKHCPSVLCGPNEQCFLEQTLNGNATTVYNGGCRSNQVCALMSTLPGKRNLVSCAECCSNSTRTTACNADLCGANKVHPTVAKPSGIFCKQCSDTTHTKECPSVICGSDEQCFLEKIINDNATVVYNGGCRSIQVCKIMSSLAGKRSLVACSECCSSTSTSPCNANLCGLDIAQPVPVHHSRIHCLGCKNSVDTKHCPSVLCGPNEQCFLEQTLNGNATIVYNGGCRSNQVCALMSTLPGKRNLVICAECCSNSTRTTACNADLCGANKVHPTVGKPSGIFCKQCSDATHTMECPSVICGPDEQCFLEKIINDNATVVYNGGCRSTQVCRIMSTLAGKRSLVACSECCSSTSTSPCNANLCGLDIAQPAPVHHSEIHCLGCKNSVDTKHCPSVLCGPNEQCFLEQTLNGNATTVYNGGCRSNQVCALMSTLPVKRNLVTCAECCSNSTRTTACNADLCGANKVHPTVGKPSGIFCKQCFDTTHTKECPSVICGPDEQCFLEKRTTNTFQSLYNAGCRSNMVCSIIATLQGPSVGKRDIVNCAECCSNSTVGYVCNADLCGLKSMM